MFVQISGAVSVERAEYQTPRARGERVPLSEGIFFNILWYFTKERLRIMVCTLSLCNELISKRKSCLQEEWWGRWYEGWSTMWYDHGVSFLTYIWVNAQPYLMCFRRTATGSQTSSLKESVPVLSSGLYWQKVFAATFPKKNLNNQYSSVLQNQLS